VKLDDTGADGFVPARTIGADYFRYDEARRALIGDRTGEAYRLGDRATVKLVEAAPVAGALRFEILSDGNIYKAHRPPKTARKGGFAREAKPERQGRKRHKTNKSKR
jgi:ribonuclease R